MRLLVSQDGQGLTFRRELDVPGGQICLRRVLIGNEM